MRTNRGFIVVMALAAVAMRPSVAAAQLSTNELPVAVGKKVTVTTDDGRKTNGEVYNLTPTTMDVSDGGVIKTFAISDVKRLQERDSTKNGIIKGAIWVGLGGLLVGAVADAGNAVGDIFGGSLVLLLGGEPEPIKGTNHAMTGAVAGVAIGALVGYALDADRMKTLYEREAIGMTVGVRPIVSAAGKGVGVQVRW